MSMSITMSEAKCTVLDGGLRAQKAVSSFRVERSCQPLLLCAVREAGAGIFRIAPACVGLRVCRGAGSIWFRPPSRQQSA